MNAMIDRIVGPTNLIEPLTERDYLVRFNAMREILNRQPQPLEPLMNLD